MSHAGIAALSVALRTLRTVTKPAASGSGVPVDEVARPALLRRPPEVRHQGGRDAREDRCQGAREGGARAGRFRVAGPKAAATKSTSKKTVAKKTAAKKAPARRTSATSPRRGRVVTVPAGVEPDPRGWAWRAIGSGRGNPERAPARADRPAGPRRRVAAAARR